MPEKEGFDPRAAKFSNPFEIDKKNDVIQEAKRATKEELFNEKKDARRRKERILSYGDIGADDRIIIERLDQIIEAPIFDTGESVNVGRSSGEVEPGWTITEVRKIGDELTFEVSKVAQEINPKTGAFDTASKTVSEEVLAKWNS